MFAKAKGFLDGNTVHAKDAKEFGKFIEGKKMVHAYFCEEKGCEAQVKEKFGVTSRCIPFSEKEKKGKCIFCGKAAARRTLFAKAY